MPDLAGKKTAYFGFTGIIEPSTATRLAAAFNHAVNNACDEVYLCISSYGGTIADGVFLYNHIRALPIHVIAHNVGSVCSIATAVFVGATERYCSTHSVFLIHPSTMGPFPDRLPWERLQSALNSALADDQRTENILRERTTLPNEMLDARRFKDVYVTPQQAVEFGLVREIREFVLPKGNEIIQI